MKKTRLGAAQPKSKMPIEATADESQAMVTEPTNNLGRLIYNERGRSIAWAIRDIHRLYTAALGPLVSRGGVTVGHWYYLRVLSEHDGIIQQDLSERVGIHPNTAVTALVDMEKHGLIRRERSSRDKRRIKVYITAKGRRLRDEMQPGVRGLTFQSVAGISEADLEATFRVLDRILQNLAAVVPNSERKTATSYHAVAPPSTTKSAPVTKELSSDARKRATHPTSSG
jgi:MarR family transcriptional regulator, organic hydroperoxide resistance regulator